jgi:hypothetical protein
MHKYIQMNTLTKTIQSAVEKSVSQSINNLFEKIVDRWEDITLEELQTLWNDDDNNIKVSKTNTKTPPSKKKTEDDDGEDTENNKEGGCPYIFAKGEKEGSICGSKAKSGCEYCSRHQKFEGVGQDIKKKTPKTKTSSSIGDKSTVSNKVKASPSKKPLERIIKLNKDINKFWNAETQLVFKSKDERVVYATYRDDVLNEINDDDIILCEQYGFKYEKSSIEEEDDIEEKKAEPEKKKAEPEKKKVEKKTEPEKKKVEPEKKKVEEKKVEPEKKKVEEKKVEEKKVEEKKSLSSAINENNIKAKDIENILNELQLSNEDDEDDEFIEEEEVDEEEDE